MSSNNFLVKTATEADIQKWFEFTGTVVDEFYDIDLPHDETFRSTVIKNIKRGTAIYIENNNQIIGAMIYSPNQNHIGWLAVHKQYRRQGIGTALVNYMFEELPDRKQFLVKTFIEGEAQSLLAHPFYKSLGFVAKEIDYSDMQHNANHPMQIFIKENTTGD